MILIKGLIISRVYKTVNAYLVNTHLRIAQAMSKEVNSFKVNWPNTSRLMTLALSALKLMKILSLLSNMMINYLASSFITCSWIPTPTICAKNWWEYLNPTRNNRNKEISLYLETHLINLSLIQCQDAPMMILWKEKIWIENIQKRKYNTKLSQMAFRLIHIWMIWKNSKLHVMILRINR